MQTMTEKKHRPFIYIHMTEKQREAANNAAHDHCLTLSELVRVALAEKIERGSAEGVCQK